MLLQTYLFLDVRPGNGAFFFEGLLGESKVNPFFDGFEQGQIIDGD